MEPKLTADDIRRGDAAAGPPRPRACDTETSVTALYQAHAVGLIRLAVVMLGDRAGAEDVVQEAFAGLYRRWNHLSGPDRALGYVRASVLNGCRSRLRARVRDERLAAASPATLAAASAEEMVLVGEEHAEVLAALRRLPDRQREALVLRYFLDMSEPEIAASMGIGQGTVKSTTSRALAALGRLLEESR
ncbi:MAG TPA: SigE family RNA polymerase sigma factor [Streptosporangiaceae bacterium]|nr:SigE family RNA polymerase sigma factor [Streptosporangiaceae bacterium]